MAASIFDSPLHADLLPTGETGRLFSDTAILRALLVVEGALAKAQGRLGVIPEISATAIHRASLDVEIDPAALAAATGRDGVCVPGLLEAFRAATNAPEHAQYVHWGATSQDIIDSALMLRLRQTLGHLEEDLRTVVTKLASQAERHAETPMAARTYGQIATPTTWGCVLGSWGNPLLDALEDLPRLRQGSLWVSLGGAAGTSATLGDDPAAVRRALATDLRLADPQRCWHTDRGPVLRITDWMGRITVALGAMGRSLIGHSASGIAEVTFSAAGTSSAMPQKQNPVAASMLVALSHQAAGLQSGLSASGLHQHQRDGAAWFTEWLLLPQMALSAAAALRIARDLLDGLTPQTEQMALNAAGDLGLIHAEALSFALAKTRPRPEAQALTRALCAQAKAEGRSLADVARGAVSDLPDGLFSLQAHLGDAPRAAQDFAARVHAI